MLNVKLASGTVISAGRSSNVERESPGLCLWRRLLHYLQGNPIPLPSSSHFFPLSATGPLSASWLSSHGIQLSTVWKSLPSSGGHFDLQKRGKEVFGEGHTKPVRKEMAVQHFWGSELTGAAAVILLFAPFAFAASRK